MTAVFAFKRKAQKTNLTIRTFLLTIKSRISYEMRDFLYLSTFIFLL